MRVRIPLPVVGLPPGFNYDSFVEFKVDPKDTSRFFRPCGNQSPTTTTCDPASPPKPWEVRNDLTASDTGTGKKVEQYWLLSNYYWSFSPKDQYPWSSLGYSFDWAPREDGSEDFVRWGESEFVISPEFRSGTSLPRIRLPTALRNNRVR
jgi:hypothetical protein